MILNIQDDILKLHAMGLLDRLLLDKTTGRHIMWATDAYAPLGPPYGRNEEIRPELITGPHSGVIRTRARKELEQQSSRTRRRGEVSTPLWVCRKMCGCFDESGRGKARWQEYVDARVLEITCGEAPFLVSRYDVETGEAIPISDRIGLLDRKLRAVNENAQAEEDWLNWAFRAFRATYGYEFQGDNVLIARVNLLETFEEYLLDRWKRTPTLSEYGKLITVIDWNIWQMDGLKGRIPYGTAEEKFQEIDWFGMLGEDPERDAQPRCRIKNWLGGGSVEYAALPAKGKRAMRFDFVIGNPPYQEELEGTSDRPIYNEFMSAVYRIADKAELITPARFLFNAGKTPKAWNKKMLEDPHLKVLWYRAASGTVFPSTDIKGGVVITYRSEKESFGAIKLFTPYEELNAVLRKVLARDFSAFNALVFAPESYRISKKLHADYPDAAARLSKGHLFDLTTNIFERLPQVFFQAEPADGQNYVGLMGRENNRRTVKWIRRDYLEPHANLDFFKVILPKANGSGALGEELSAPVIGRPAIGHNQTFISIGAFETEEEAEACLNYVKSKFARALLGTLKVTQDNKKAAWANVPLQDFTPASDIDWTKSIPEIDRQLYAKYGLDETEIRFIETHVKEMA